MIIRVFRAIVHDNKQKEFESFFLNIALPSVKSYPGLLSVSVGRPLPTSPNEFSMVMVWKDIDSLKGFAGHNWWEARIEPEEEHLLVETFVYHYEFVTEERND